MDIESLKNKLVAVLGYGQEGKATARYLIKHGVKPVLFDQKPWDKWQGEEKEKIKSLGVNFIFGPDCFKELAGFDVAFRSPGIPLSRPDLAKWMEPSPQPSPKGRGRLEVTSQTKWFFEHCPAKIIGVTGTKGKGTTSALLYEMLHASRFTLHANTYLTGNIGQTQPFDIIDNLKKDDLIVYELSSFQLQDLDRSPHIAVVLMITSEHLDYHKNIDEYIEAKSTITKFQNANDFAIYNVDYPSSIKIGKQGRGKKIYFSRQKELENGCFIVGDNLIVKNVLEANFQLSTLNFQLKGRHNLENVCAAVAAAALAGAGEDAIKEAINTFKGLPHRLELVAEKDGIKFYDDSISTTPETAIAAINSFSEPLILILGGSSKNSDFTELGKTINEAKNIKAIVLIGEEAGRVKQAIESTSISNPSPNGRGEGVRVKILENVKNMQEIFRQIKQVAASGDVVLLSPACASFDMFTDYKDRGEQFKNEVNKF